MTGISYSSFLVLPRFSYRFVGVFACGNGSAIFYFHLHVITYTYSIVYSSSADETRCLWNFTTLLIRLEYMYTISLSYVLYFFFLFFYAKSSDRCAVSLIPKKRTERSPCVGVKRVYDVMRSAPQTGPPPRTINLDRIFEGFFFFCFRVVSFCAVVAARTFTRREKPDKKQPKEKKTA